MEAGRRVLDPAQPRDIASHHVDGFRQGPAHRRLVDDDGGRGDLQDQPVAVDRHDGDQHPVRQAPDPLGRLRASGRRLPAQRQGVRGRRRRHDLCVDEQWSELGQGQGGGQPAVQPVQDQVFRRQGLHPRLQRRAATHGVSGRVGRRRSSSTRAARRSRHERSGLAGPVHSRRWGGAVETFGGRGPRLGGSRRRACRTPSGAGPRVLVAARGHEGERRWLAASGHRGRGAVLLLVAPLRSPVRPLCARRCFTHCV
mmetsp:Transcript_67781/g.185873  ORF Transcript_67781/g.185873 Transcript_67781/m.185873 type:complete len:255 (+) Transcript_67781:793-1557(+)